MKNSIVCSKKPNIVWISEKLIEDRFDANPFKAEYIEDEIKESKFYKCKTINDILRSNKDLTGGSTPLGANYIESGIRFIRTQDVDFNWIDIDNTVFISEEDDKKLKRSSLEVDDVLLTITGVKFGKSAPVRKTCLPANISQHSVKMHFKEGLDPYYISTFLNCLYGQKQIFKKSVGATRPAIDYSGIKTIKIPIPLAEIQKYIGDKVREAEELREEVKMLEKDLNNSINSLLLQNIDIPSENKFLTINCDEIIDNKFGATIYRPVYVFNRRRLKKEIKLIKLKDVCSKIYDGNHGGIHPKNILSEGEIPFIRTQDAHDGLIEVNKYISLEEYKILKHKGINYGDIVYGIKGSVGSGGIYLSNKSDATINPACVVLRPQKTLNSGYLLAVLESEFFRKEINRYAEADSTRPQISKTEFENLEIPLLHQEGQKIIGDFVMEKICKTNQVKELIQQAKQDVEDLIEGNFDMSKIKETN